MHAVCSVAPCVFIFLYREQLTNNLQFLNSLIIETLLFGDDSLSEEQNAQLFKSVQLYINVIVCKYVERTFVSWNNLCPI